MKIVFFGYDYTLDIAQRLMADGHELLRIFTFPCDDLFAFNTQTKEFSMHFKIPIFEHRIESGDIDSLIGQGAQIFICAGYPHRIPDIDASKAFGINLHPSLLPRARGIMPLPHIIMREPEAAGFTIHKLVSTFDAGDILYQEAVPIDQHTDVETLSARIALRAPGAISDVVENIEKYWKQAKPQDDKSASSYRSPSDKMRSLDWSDTAEELMLKSRAFGRFGVLASITNDMGQTQKLGVFQFTTWKEDHNFKVGTLIRSSSREIIIAIQDGFACLKEFQVIQ